MKILYISQFYEPENIAPAFRATEHSRLWAAVGEDVTVLSGWPNYPMGEIFDGYEVEMLQESSLKGVRLLRSKLVAKPNTSFVNRIENGLSFLWYGWRNLHKNKGVIGSDYDVVLATSGTVFAGYLGYRYAKKMKRPFVIEYRDLTYSQLLATGSSERSMKYRGMKWLELMMARKASRVVVLTNSFKATLVEDGIAANKISVVPNGADIVDCEPNKQSTLTFGYFGTMGWSQVIPETIQVFKALNGVVSGFKYLLVGEGAARDLVEEEAAKPENDFVELLHGMPKDELEKYYATLDLSVVSLRRSEAFSGTIPSKIFQSWARGIPVLFVGPDGEAASLIRDFGLGLTLCGSDDENKESLASFFSNPEWRSVLDGMGAKAKQVMRENFTREHLAAEMLKTIKSVNQEGKE